MDVERTWLSLHSETAKTEPEKMPLLDVSVSWGGPLCGCPCHKSLSTWGLLEGIFGNSLIDYCGLERVRSQPRIIDGVVSSS